MTSKKRAFPAAFIADLSKLLIGSGAVKQLFAEKYSLREILVVTGVAVITFLISYWIYPKE